MFGASLSSDSVFVPDEVPGGTSYATNGSFAYNRAVKQNNDRAYDRIQTKAQGQHRYFQDRTPSVIR